MPSSPSFARDAYSVGDRCEEARMGFLKAMLGGRVVVMVEVDVVVFSTPEPVQFEVVGTAESVVLASDVSELDPVVEAALVLCVVLEVVAGGPELYTSSSRMLQPVEDPRSVQRTLKNCKFTGLKTTRTSPLACPAAVITGVQ